MLMLLQCHYLEAVSQYQACMDNHTELMGTVSSLERFLAVASQGLRLLDRPP